MKIHIDFPHIKIMKLTLKGKKYVLCWRGCKETSECTACKGFDDVDSLKDRGPMDAKYFDHLMRMKFLRLLICLLQTMMTKKEGEGLRLILASCYFSFQWLFLLVFFARLFIKELSKLFSLEDQAQISLRFYYYC